ncbi:hypothetical protein I4U23_027172 [Adineta vaga]|nr:hypothetical protein I4U23_027172 [Adineta vaga]
MKQAVFLLILTTNIVNIDGAKRIAYVYNASYISVNHSVSITYQNTCSECICQGLLANVYPPYVGLNCYNNNKTCVLFTEYTSISMIRINLDSTFIFTQLSLLQNTSTVSFPLSGVTVAGYENGSSGAANNALNEPWGLAVGANDTLYVVDSSNNRVMRFQEGSLSGTVVAGTTSGGKNADQLKDPTEISIDANLNLYINDQSNHRVMLWYNGATSGIVVAGNSSSGATLSTLNTPIGLAVDSQKNIYISDSRNHRVVQWTSTSIAGTIIAGITNIWGRNNTLLNTPAGLYFDEDNSYLYIADRRNFRIQRYSLGNTLHGTTVAGGNGAGLNDISLDTSYGVCISKNTGNIYIADTANHRIQRWSPGATSGVTIVGVTGISGNNATLLNGPKNVALSLNETYLTQNVLLIWLDSSIDEANEDCQQTIIELQHVMNAVSTYTNSDQCIEFIKTIKDHKMCMIISGYLGQHIVPRVHDLSQVDSIFILCGNKSRHEQWAKQWPKVKGVFTETKPMCKALKQAAQQCEQNAISMSFVPMAKKLDQLDPSFIKARNVSLGFAECAARNPDLVGILFVMTIDPTQSTTAFASIRDISAITHEDEVLFSMHSVFRIQDVKQIGGNNKLFEVNMTLTGDKDIELSALTDRLREESFPNEEGWARLGLVLKNMGQNDKAEEIYRMLLDQKTEENIKGKIPKPTRFLHKNQILSMDNHDLHSILLNRQDRFTNDDRKRLHSFLGNDISHEINEQDLIYLINAFHQIHCFDASKLLKEHLNEKRINGLNQSIQSLSLIMPPILDQLLQDDEKDKLIVNSVFIQQENISQNHNANINPYEKLSMVETRNILVIAFFIRIRNTTKHTQSDQTNTHKSIPNQFIKKVNMSKQNRPPETIMGEVRVIKQKKFTTFFARKNEFRPKFNQPYQHFGIIGDGYNIYDPAHWYIGTVERKKLLEKFAISPEFLHNGETQMFHLKNSSWFRSYPK